MERKVVSVLYLYLSGKYGGRGERYERGGDARETVW